MSVIFLPDCNEFTQELVQQQEQWSEFQMWLCLLQIEGKPAKYKSLENKARQVALRSTPVLVIPFTSNMTLPYFS